MKSPVVRRAMTLAAGYGKRMRPLTDARPKVLVEVHGKALIDHALDRLDAAGIETVVVNVHYLADMVEAHLERRERPRIVISDERDALLDTGGAIKRALHLFEGEPFLTLNGDSFWLESAFPTLGRMMDCFDPARMDAVLMLAPIVRSVGYDGRGDFLMSPEGVLRRRPERELAPFVYAGAALLHPRLFKDCPETPFSMNVLFDRAIEAERLYGMRMDGLWLHVGTPEAVRDAEAVLSPSPVQ